MKNYDFPTRAPDDLMAKIHKSIETRQKLKRQRKRRLTIATIIFLLFAIPASAYSIVVGNWWGSSSGVELAIQHGQAIAIDEPLHYEGFEIQIEKAVWEDDELAITYMSNREDFWLEQVELVNEKGEKLNTGYSRGGRMGGGGLINFTGIDLARIEDSQIWLRIISLDQYQAPSQRMHQLELPITRAMRAGEFVDIDREIQLEKGKLLFQSIRFGENDTKINYQFTPRDKYKKFFHGKTGSSEPVSSISLTVDGQTSRYNGGSRSARDSILFGTVNFDKVAIANASNIQVNIIDSLVLVDWQVAIPVVTKETNRLEVGRAVSLPEGELILTEIRHGTKSTAIDFVFEPAPDFEGISSITFGPFLRSGEKYYNYHSFNHRGHTPGLAGTVVFDPVGYDKIKELELIPGRIVYHYDTDARVTVSPENLPQEIGDLGSNFTIDKMMTKNDHTYLHISFPRENRRHYDGIFRVEAPRASSLRTSIEYEEGPLQYREEQDLKDGLAELKEILGPDNEEFLKDVDLNRGIIGKAVETSGEHEELIINLTGLSTLRFSGKPVKLPIK